MIKEQIKKWFFEAVRLEVQAPQELRDAVLKGHPRLELFLNNMTEQILAAEKVCESKGVRLSQKTLQMFTYDMAKYFLMGVEGEAKRRYESDLERAAREAEAQKVKEFDEVIAGKPSGEFAEAGVITNEKIDKEREQQFEIEFASKQKGT